MYLRGRRALAMEEPVQLRQREHAARMEAEHGEGLGGLVTPVQQQLLHVEHAIDLEHAKHELLELGL